MSNVDPRWAPPVGPPVVPARQQPHRAAYLFAVLMPLILIAATALPAAIALWVVPALRGPAVLTTSDPVNPVDGSAGLGDQYYPNAGNGGYDVIRYDLDLNWDPKSQTLTGKATINARATLTLKSFFVDLALEAKQVDVDGRPATTARKGFSDLQILPQQQINAGSTFTVTVDYAGKPGSIKRGKLQPWWTSGQEWITAGEPESSAWWFPGNDHPSDPALMDVSIRVPAGMEAISTGALISADSAKDGGADEANFDTWHWATRQPVVTYATFIAIGQYELKQGVDHGLPYVYAVSEQLSPAQRAEAFTELLRSGERVKLLEQLFGPYPFTELGGIVPVHDLWFEGLETQTRPIYVARSILNPDFVTQLLDHELAHMWFGDNVSLRQWDDVFNSEAYASWAAWATAERTGGRSANDALNQTYERTAGSRDFWSITMIDPTREHLFDTVYIRGPMALQALSNVIGEDAFLQLSREWGQTPGSRSVEEFMAMAQNYSSVDLGPFFQAWIYSPTAPARTAENGFR